MMSDPQTMLAFGVATATCLGLAVLCWRHRGFTPSQLALWYFARFLVRFLWHAKQPRKLPLAPGQGAVIVCNHRSSIDPIFVQTLVEQPIHFLVAREYFQHWAFGWLLRTCEHIPTARSGVDTAATMSAIRYAAEGKLVGMLPEGRINQTDEFMLPVRPGAVLVALKSRVSILPVYIDGAPFRGTPASPLFMFAHVRVSVGQPIDLSEYFGREDEPGLLGELTLRVVRVIAALAGRDEFQPTLAGRHWKPDAHPQ